MAKKKKLHPTAVCRHRSYGDFYEIIVRYTDPDTGKVRPHTHITDIPYDGTEATEKAVISSPLAQKTLQEVRDILSGKISEDTQDKHILFADYFDKWLDYRRDIDCKLLNKIAETSVHEYKYHVNGLKKYFKKNPVLLDRINERHIQEYMKYLQANGYKNIYIDAKLGIIQQILNRAVKDKLIEKNPIIYIDKPKKEIPEERPYLIISELGILLKRAEGKDIEPLVYIIVFLGVRIGEACGITWDCIDFEKNTIKIEKQEVNSSGRKITNRLKTPTSYAIMPLSEPLKNYLLKLKEQQEHDKQYCGNSYFDPNPDVVIRTWNGKSLTKGTWRTKFRKFILEQPDLPYITPHCLRHSFNAAQQELEIPDDLRAELLRDKEKTLPTYNHTSKKNQKGAMETYAAVIDNARNRVYDNTSDDTISCVPNE